MENALACGIKANISRPVQCFDKDESYRPNVVDGVAVHAQIGVFQAAEARPLGD